MEMFDKSESIHLQQTEQCPSYNRLPQQQQNQKTLRSVVGSASVTPNRFKKLRKKYQTLEAGDLKYYKSQPLIKKPHQGSNKTSPPHSEKTPLKHGGSKVVSKNMQYKD